MILINYTNKKGSPQRMSRQPPHSPLRAHCARLLRRRE